MNFLERVRHIIASIGSGMSKPSSMAAHGGDAEVDGNNSQAVGGDGGQGVDCPGGRGGHAKVLGDRSKAVGGKGGRGGVGPGMPGMDVEVDGDDQRHYGGGGGEAGQRDGRGGRGGIPGGIDDMSSDFAAIYRRAHMKAPYGEHPTAYGRGGDAADTLQYKARRLIIERLKAEFFTTANIQPEDKWGVWYDREIVPIDWLNACLRRDGHRWQAQIVDDEYEFTDMVGEPK